MRIPAEQLKVNDEIVINYELHMIEKVAISSPFVIVTTLRNGDSLRTWFCFGEKVLKR